MKKITLLTLVTGFALLLSSSIIHAKIWRVNNQSNYDNVDNFGENYGGTPVYPVFKQINEAVANANVVDGDTLHIEASTLVYSGASINKRLTIIGSGYFVEENQNVSNSVYNSRVRDITFNDGSEFSQLIGLHIIRQSSSITGKVNVLTNEITVKRCLIDRGVAFESGLLSVFILQNFFTNQAGNALINSSSSSFIPPQDIVFNNNILRTKLIWTGRNILECNNNVFDGPPNELNLDFNTDSFQNNILRSPGITANINNGTNANVEYNTVSNSGVFADTPGNVWEPAMNNLFLDSESPDGMYQLQPDTANNVPGKDGAERGAFGGAVIADRYNLSGLAPIPVIYSVSTTGVSESDTGLPVQVKARTNY